MPVALRYLRIVSVLWAVTAGNFIAPSPLAAQTPRPVLGDVSAAAKLISFQGRLVVDRNGSPWRLDVGEFVFPSEVITTGADGSGMFRVADGSTFEVFPNSKVAFRTNRGNWEDLLELWLGKVRVQIEHPGGAPNHNKVTTPTAVISVRGTIFDVDYDADADATTVLDEEGSVEVARALRLNETRILNPTETVKVYKNAPLARAVIDKGDLLKRIFRTLVDTATQEAINIRTGSPSGAGASTVPSTGGSTTVGDKNNSPTPPPPPPPPPPPAH